MCLWCWDSIPPIHTPIPVPPCMGAGSVVWTSTVPSPFGVEAWLNHALTVPTCRWLPCTTVCWWVGLRLCLTPPSRLSGTGGLPGTSSCLSFLLELAPMAQVPKCVSSHVAACWWTECSYFKIMSSYSPKVMPDRAAFFSIDRLLLRCF